MNVLIGDKIKNNINELISDPIVLKMYDELLLHNIDIHNIDAIIVNREYSKRGGKSAITIGAVKYAIMKIDKNVKDFVK